VEQETSVVEYKCPCCGAGLKFSGDAQVMTCEYCDNQFEVEAVKAYNEEAKSNVFHWESQSFSNWTDDDQACLQTFICQSCGGELTTDEHTAATFCPYCDNPAILPNRLSGTIRPDGVIPFRKTKEEAQKVFKELCKKKPLLPKDFASEHRIEKITGIYIPFWLYDCDGTFHGQYKATRVRHWSDAHYNYTKTDHYLLKREASAQFSSIPMDASSKFRDEVMESIEPFDYTQMVDFESAYLSGFFADKYDVEAISGQKRIEQRVEDTLKDHLAETYIGYTSVIPTSNHLQVDHGNAKYVLLPAWVLYTKYQDNTYLFAMNGQTGKMTGTFPICPKRSVAWFSGICAAVTALVSLIMILFG
jgi:uncharacterized CHY-type Zn-finger protein